MKTDPRIYIRKLNYQDAEQVFVYLQALSPQTKNRFGPHAFDRDTIVNVLNDTEQITAFGAIDPESGTLISYALIRAGYLPHDKARLESYGLRLSETTDCTFAPSVADDWQNKGVGSLVFRFLLENLPPACRRIILWGGVQADNHLAVNYYLRRDFRILGEFEHYGKNYDMYLNLL